MSILRELTSALRDYQQLNGPSPANRAELLAFAVMMYPQLQQDMDAFGFDPRLLRYSPQFAHGGGPVLVYLAMESWMSPLPNPASHSL